MFETEKPDTEATSTNKIYPSRASVRPGAHADRQSHQEEEQVKMMTVLG